MNLRSNISKGVVMRFCACNNLSCSYTTEGKVLDFVSCHRVLGMLVDSKLGILS